MIIGLLARRAHIDANLCSLAPNDPAAFFSGKFSADAKVSFLIHAGTGPVCLVQYLRTRSPIKTGDPPSFWIDSTAGKTNEETWPFPIKLGANKITRNCRMGMRWMMPDDDDPISFGLLANLKGEQTCAASD